MIQAMYSGIAGLKAFKSSLDVIGNNIANVNTIAYKAGRVTFKEALSQTISGATSPSETRGGTNAVQLGLGVTVGSIDPNMSGGSPQSTGRQTDLMIDGGGYFALGDGSKKVYTRDGGFSLDAENNLVSSSSGWKVLGWTADPLTGVVDSGTGITGSSGINIPVGLLSSARATSKFAVAGNLDDTAALAATREVQSQVYDSLGIVHNVNITYTRAANNTDDEPVWDYEVKCPDVHATNVVKSGSINFGTHGESKVSNVDIDLTFATNNGSVQPLSIAVDTSGITSIGGPYSITSRGGDGLALGTLESYTIGQDGSISGQFNNGASRPLGKIAIAQFTNASGLSKLGSNTLSESPNSGTAQIGVAGVGGRGLISSGFLEASNVDLAQEFANMIVAQRGFQANSRIITTSDQILQELVQMKQ